ncbi:L-threonylcarbamoyladenylate synthase [Pannus brasiliensis CCIBt3594]|uniref:L-threonylcarbamoyladenylate synthase n=1 Tax=Pannus brasiliensis CCIBt3594 TaxID=1427578 RepID=A0AAW9QXL2_9CHRO
MPFSSRVEIVRAASSGKVISFPTDTVPALAVSPAYSPAIFHLKQRQPDKPLILMAASESDIRAYVTGTGEEWQIWREIMEKYWPGQLTLVLPASEKVPRAMNPLDPTTIGVRIPDSSIAREILAETGALATTSANRSGESPLLTATDIERTFPGVYVLESGNWNANSSGQPSTVARWNGNGWDILRQGKIIL